MLSLTHTYTHLLAAPDGLLVTLHAGLQVCVCVCACVCVAGMMVVYRHFGGVCRCTYVAGTFVLSVHVYRVRE